MNKTININLGGVFFHIDEIAYQKLKSYLDAIRRSLSDDPKGRDEIITDIESRIGELLSDKVKDVRQVVNQQDIDEVIDIMGKPEDYLVDDEIFSDDSYSTDRRKKPRKLYRDGSDRFLGGVSSGMAHYLNVDVIWIRLGWLWVSADRASPIDRHIVMHIVFCGRRLICVLHIIYSLLTQRDYGSLCPPRDLFRGFQSDCFIMFQLSAYRHSAFI